MARWYSDEDIERLEDERASLLLRRVQTQERFLQHQFKSQQAKEFGIYGFSRRLSILDRCIENTFSAIPPKFDGVPTLDQTGDVMIQVQAFIFNVFGCLDNLAWMWVLERNVTKDDGQPLPRGWIGLRPDNKDVRKSLGQELRQVLEGMDDWFTDLESLRHSLAHQIPLYVPPFSVSPHNAEKYRELEQSIFELVLQRDEAQARAQEYERDSLRFFRPWIVGSWDGQQKVIQFHPKMLCDFKTVEMIGVKLLGDLARCSS